MHECRCKFVMETVAGYCKLIIYGTDENTPLLLQMISDIYKTRANIEYALPPQHRAFVSGALIKKRTSHQMETNRLSEESRQCIE